jgi:hypothetical protein
MVYNIAKPIIDQQDINNDNAKPPIDMVSATIMAKVLEDREKERIFARHCNTCTCHRSVLKVDNESQTTLEQDKSNLSSAKDYFKAFNYNELRNTKNSKASSYSDIKDMSLNYSKRHSQYNKSYVKSDTYHCASEIAESKLGMNSEHLKTSYPNNSNANTYFNLKNSNNRNVTKENNVEDKSKSINEVDRMEAQSSLYIFKKTMSENKSSKEMENFDDQAKIDMINERLWKSNWMNSKSMQNTKESEVQIEVINERLWKNNNKSLEKSPPLTVIEVKSTDDLINENEKMQREPTTSPSFSGESIIISSSDPSSLSSDVVFNHPQWMTKKEGVSGPRNCLMRVTTSSKNILFDNAGAYQTVLYTSGCSRPNTALVHVAKSFQSGRSASISSEENAPCTIQESAQQQRVAQWVNTLSSNCHTHNIQAPNTSFQHSLFNVNLKSKEIDDSLSPQAEQQLDLITFEGSSDDEHKFPVDYIYQDNVTKETYVKLATNLDPISLEFMQAKDVDLMTVEKYRKQKKDSHRNLQANFYSKT